MGQFMNLFFAICIISKYASGMTNQEIFEYYVNTKDLIEKYTPPIYNWLGRYLWGDEGEVIIRRVLKKLLGVDPESRVYTKKEILFWESLHLRFLKKGESREKILKDLSLPSPLCIYERSRKTSFRRGPSGWLWVDLKKNLEKLSTEKDFQALFSKIEKSLLAFFDRKISPDFQEFYGSEISGQKFN